MEGGTTWRRVSWQKARAELLPKLPIEIVRPRGSRAKELGLPHQTYASVRAATGCHVIGSLLSANALRMRHTALLPQARQHRRAPLEA